MEVNGPVKNVFHGLDYWKLKKRTALQKFNEIDVIDDQLEKTRTKQMRLIGGINGDRI